jgi:hypothetical protein
MYIDSLTVTAFVVFAICFALFVKFCVLNICGLSSEDKEELRARFKWGSHS